MANIDERLEALTRNLEILTLDVEGMKGIVKEIAEGTARLLHVAELHQERLDSHGDRLDNLEG